MFVTFQIIFYKVGETLNLLSAWDIRPSDCQFLSNFEVIRVTLSPVW